MMNQSSRTDAAVPQWDKFSDQSLLNPCVRPILRVHPKKTYRETSEGTISLATA